MGRKQKEKATKKEISQKSCATENEEDETGSDCCSSTSVFRASSRSITLLSLSSPLHAQEGESQE